MNCLGWRVIPEVTCRTGHHDLMFIMKGSYEYGNATTDDHAAVRDRVHTILKTGHEYGEIASARLRQIRMFCH